MATSSKSPAVWSQLGTLTAQWFIQQLRSNGIRSPFEIKKKQQELNQITLSKFFQRSHTEKFQCDADKAEPFIREYFSAMGLDKNDVDKLIIQAKHLKKGLTENKVFEFVKKEGGRYAVYYIALLREDDMFYISFTSSQFQFALSPSYSGWWIFTQKEYRALTLGEQKSLQNFFLYEALQICHQSLIVDVAQLPQEDRKFLEFSE